MKVVTYVESLARAAGSERVQLDVCGALAARGHQITVVYREDGPVRREWASFTKDAVAAGSGGWRELGSVLRCRSSCFGASDTVAYVHHNGHWGNLSFLALQKVLWGRPAVLHVHLPYTGQYRLPRAVLPLLRRICSGVIYVSRATMASWRDAGFAGPGDTVVLNGVDPRRISPAGPQSTIRATMGIPDDSVVFAMVGRITVEKGAHVLVDAWRALGDLPGTSDVWLAVIGEIDGDETASRIAGSPRTTVLGWVDDVGALYRSVDAVVVPSVWPEPYGLVLVEALGCGVPVVATDVGGTAEALGRWGVDHPELIVAPGDAGALVAALGHLADMRNEGRSRLGDDGSAFVVRERLLEQTVDAVERQLLAALGGSRRRARTLSDGGRVATTTDPKKRRWTRTAMGARPGAFRFTDRR